MTNTMNPPFPRGSLRATRSGRTVLLRMAEDLERAQRIRECKEARPDLTWHRIAQYVGVTERAAAEWKNTGGISWQNAIRLAELFEVDRDWLWRGPVEEAPNLLETVARADQLDRVVERFSGRVDDVEERLERLATTQAAIEDLVRRQGAILERIELLVATLPTDETTRRLVDELRGRGAA